MIMENIFFSFTIINKYGLLHTTNIIYMGLFDYYNYAMNVWLMQEFIMQEFKYEKINNAGK